MTIQNSETILVAFRPPAAELRRDVLFYGESYQHVGDASHWIEPTKTLAQIGHASGVEFHTDDAISLKDAAVLVFGELPTSRREVLDVRRMYPHLKLILQIWETPLGRRWVFDPANHSDFDAVVSYDPAHAKRKNYFPFMIPAGGISSAEIPSGATWHDRKIACMVANVPNVRPAIPRRTGLAMMWGGWKFTPFTWWNYITEGGTLYGERLRVAQLCDEMLSGQFDIYGPGWLKAEGGEKQSGQLVSARGAYKGSKLDLLQNYRFTFAYENCLNDCGYISEKLFDALLAGCVPVYLGNTSIGKYLPEDAFVDARKFRTRSALVRHVQKMSESEWRSMRLAGIKFITNDADRRFGSMQYVTAMMNAIRYVTNTQT